jgi:hypothetical protein
MPVLVRQGQGVQAELETATAEPALREGPINCLEEADSNPQLILQKSFAAELSDVAAVELARGLLADPRLAPLAVLSAWAMPESRSPSLGGASSPEPRASALGYVLRHEPSLASSQGRATAELPAGERLVVLRAAGAATRSLSQAEADAAWGLYERCLLRLVQLDRGDELVAAQSAFQSGGGRTAEACLLALRALAWAPTAPAAARDELRVRALQAGVDEVGAEWSAWRVRLSCLLAATGPRSEAERHLAAAEGETRAALFQVQGRSGTAHAAMRADWHQRLAGVALARLCLALEQRGSVRAIDAELARLAMAACIQQALAQQQAALAGESRHASLDALLEDPEGWLALRHDAAGPSAAPLATRVALARVLGACVDAELPGLAALEPLPASVEARGVLDELRAVRRVVLRATLDAHIDDLERRASWTALVVQEREGRAMEPAAEERAELSRAAWRREELVAGRAELARGDDAVLGELRTPSWILLEAARAAREEGDYDLARRLLEGLRADLDADPRSRQWLWGIEFLAAVESSLGSTLSDQGDPRRAQAELETSLARLEELEALLERRGDAPQVLRALRSQQSSVLVSLAVNANVKQRDPQAALAWFERAWALRKDETMRVLAACYRARAGRAAEARALLEGVLSTSAVHYNLACAWALLGEREKAFEELRRELDDPRAAPGALARRKAWARADPDLSSLRDDPRFSTLLR